ncbi:MAG: glycosyltransferase family 39 protein, partial [Chloroflexota bacterium]|nr:glycosyltransferase family 39 protein [Chloroflexota bacterium]
EYTAQYAHPGVTTMWLGAIGIALHDPNAPDRTGGQITVSEIRDRLVPPDELPVDYLVEMRKAVVIASSVILALTFVALSTIVGNGIAFISAVFVASSPLMVGFTRLLHIDGLSSLLCLLALVSWVAFMHGRSRWLFGLSAVAIGLAVLTRSSNGVVALAIVLVAIGWAILARNEIGLGRVLVWLSVLGGLAVSVCILAWPALWVEPGATLEMVIEGGSDLASSPHMRQVLFRGEVTADDPGWTYYPVVLWYRLSPVTLAGCLLALAGVCIPAVGRAIFTSRALVVSLAVFAVLNGALLSLTAKKLDRYLLPSIAALDLIAVLSLVGAVAWLTDRVTATVTARAIGVAVAGVLVLAVQARDLSAAGPFYISWVSPLAGGQEAARKEMSFGWGEGGKEVAEAIAADPRLAGASLTGSTWPRTISWYLPAEIEQANYQLDADGAAWFSSMGYLILAEPERSRQFYSPDMLAWFDAQTPIATVKVDGATYAWIYDLGDLPVPDPYFNEQNRAFSWNDDTIRLVSGRYLPQVVPGMEQRIRLIFEISDAPVYYWIDLTVLDANEEPLLVESRRVRSDEVGAVSELLVIDVPIPSGTPLGRATVRASLRTDETGDVLTSTSLSTGRKSSEPVLLWFDIVEELPESPGEDIAPGAPRRATPEAEATPAATRDPAS